MPLFDFRCKKCDNTKEFLVLQREKDNYDLPKCDECDSNDWVKFIGKPTRTRKANISENDRIVGDMDGKCGWY
jgi:putative FmdB family regulatory protein